MDARLFLVRHLLILKEMTAGLELGRRDRKREWRGITGQSDSFFDIHLLMTPSLVDFLRSLLDNASTMLGYARGSLVRPSDTVPDAKIVRPACL